MKNIFIFKKERVNDFKKAYIILCQFYYLYQVVIKISTNNKLCNTPKGEFLGSYCLASRITFLL